MRLRALHAVPVASLALAVALAACAKKDDGRPRGPVEVGVVTLVAGSVTVSTELTGRTAATTVSDVRPQVDGVIKERLFKEGSLVRAGQPLYQIDPARYRAARDQAQAQLENAQALASSAQAKAKRYRELTDVEAVSRQDIDDTIAAANVAEANVHQYAAALETARINLEYTRVLAPISGRISRSSVTPGALVTANQSTALANISNSIRSTWTLRSPASSCCSCAARWPAGRCCRRAPRSA